VSRPPGQPPPSAMQSESGPAPRHRRSPRGLNARRPSRGSARRGYAIRAPGTEREPGTASSAAPVPPSIRSARPAGSPLGSCRIGAGLSSQTAACRPQSSSRRSGASRARRRTSEEPRQTPRFGYRPRRTVGPPRRRIRRVGSYCGNLGPPPQHLVSIKPVPWFAVQRGLRRRVLRGLRRDHGSREHWIGCCPFLDAMNTAHAGGSCASTEVGIAQPIQL